MLDTLGGADECEVGGRIFLLLAFLHHLLTFLVGAILPIENAGFFMLSRAAKAFRWVISRVVRNCKASYLNHASRDAFLKC